MQARSFPTLEIRRRATGSTGHNSYMRRAIAVVVVTVALLFGTGTPAWAVSDKVSCSSPFFGGVCHAGPIPSSGSPDWFIILNVDSGLSTCAYWVDDVDTKSVVAAGALPQLGRAITDKKIGGLYGRYEFHVSGVACSGSIQNYED